MIELKNIYKTYTKKKRNTKAINGISLTFNNNGIVGILGPSGCGKSTLLNILYGNVEPTSGEIYYNGNLINKNNRKDFTYDCSYVFQEYNLINSITVYDNILLAIKLHGIDKTKDIIEACLANLGLNDVLVSYPDELSGGQQQRVAIARAVLTEAKIILADEPTGALDDETANSVMSLLKELSKDKLIVIVSHNKELISKYADRIVEIKEGKIVNDTKINKIEDSSVEKRTAIKKSGYKDLFLLGFKYVNLKSFKFYLSLVLMTLSFTLLLLSSVFITFNPEKSYDNVSKEVCSYTLVTQFIDEEEDGVYQRYTYGDINTTFLQNELDAISAINNQYMKIYTRSIGFTNGEVRRTIKNCILINETFNNIDIKIYGEMPKEGEMLIPKAILDEIGVDDYKNYPYSSGFDISGCFEYNHEAGTRDVVDLNKSVFINSSSFEENNLPISLIFDKLSSKQIKDLNAIDYHGRVTFESYALDSYNRTNDFAKELMAIGIPACIIFMMLSLLLLVNYVYSTIDVNINDIKIVKMIGGTNKALATMYMVQPALMVIISLILSFIGYFVAKYYIDAFIYSYLSMATSLLVLTFSSILISVVAVLIFTILSVYIPIRKTNIVK